MKFNVEDPEFVEAMDNILVGIAIGVIGFIVVLWFINGSVRAVVS